MDIKTEEQKLRESIPLNDYELTDWLKQAGIAFERDAAGILWLSHATLTIVVKWFESLHPRYASIG